FGEERSADGEHLLLTTRQCPGGLLPSGEKHRQHFPDLLEIRLEALGPGLSPVRAHAEVLLHRQRREDAPSYSNEHDSIAHPTLRGLANDALALPLDVAGRRLDGARQEPQR